MKPVSVGSEPTFPSRALRVAEPRRELLLLRAHSCPREGSTLAQLRVGHLRPLHGSKDKAQLSRAHAQSTAEGDSTVALALTTELTGDTCAGRDLSPPTGRFGHVCGMPVGSYEVGGTVIWGVFNIAKTIYIPQVFLV